MSLSLKKRQPCVSDDGVQKAGVVEPGTTWSKTKFGGAHLQPFNEWRWETCLERAYGCARLAGERHTSGGLERGGTAARVEFSSLFVWNRSASFMHSVEGHEQLHALVQRLVSLLDFCS